MRLKSEQDFLLQVFAVSGLYFIMLLAVSSRKLQQHCMSFVVASAGVCLALKAATLAVGIPPAWHATTTFCVLCCWASRFSACASQLCWQLLSSSSASARSGKRLSLSQSNASSMLHVV
jgi:hypothetical protein